MKILITGANGYIGSVLSRSLLQNSNDEVVAFDNLLYKQTAGMDLCDNIRYEFVYGDVRDHSLLDKYIAQADVIIPLAAYVGFPLCEREKEAATAVNQNQIIHILSRMSCSQRIIYPNTNSGYGAVDSGVCTEETPLHPISHYGVTKTNAEKAVLDWGGTTLRLATVFGVSPRMRIDLLVNDFTFRAVRDRYIVLFEAHFKRNYIHVRDVAAAFELMLYSGNTGAYNVGLSNANVSKLELANLIKLVVPNFVIETNEFTKDPDQRNYIVSNEKIEKIGFYPQHSLLAGIRELVKAYKIMLPSTLQYANS